MKVGIGAWIGLSLAAVGVGYGIMHSLDKSREEEYAKASPAERGWMLIEDNGCQSCHQPGNVLRAPELKNLFGSEVTLSNGQKLIIDEAYIREAILEPDAKISAGYQAVMPSFRTRLTDAELSDIVEAMKKKD